MARREGAVVQHCPEQEFQLGRILPASLPAWRPRIRPGHSGSIRTQAPSGAPGTAGWGEEMAGLAETPPVNGEPTGDVRVDSLTRLADRPTPVVLLLGPAPWPRLQLPLCALGCCGPEDPCTDAGLAGLRSPVLTPST